MKSVFIDSNVIIRYFTGDTTAKRLLEPVFHGEVEGYINDIVFSEVVYITIKLLTGRKAYQLKSSPETVRDSIRALRDQVEFLQTYFLELEMNDEIKRLAIKIMEDYGLTPNDALIAATCRYHGIDAILTFDEGFKRVPWLKVITIK